VFSGQDEWKFKAQNEDQNMPGFQRGHADFAREPMDTQNNYREVTSETANLLVKEIIAE